MDNNDRIEKILRLIASASKNGMNIDSDSVYANLIYFGVDNKFEDISVNFDKWINHFKSFENIGVFVNPNWDCFCQFVSSNIDRYHHNCNIKIYIPIDSEHIEKSAIILFEFLTRENIIHLSKIGKFVRFDDVVIRTNNSENANKIIEFVNNNEYIKEGLLKGNPFAVCVDNISMVYDNSLSYNMVVSSWISNYINWECKNNNLDNVSFLRFRSFVEVSFKSIFEKGEGLQEYLDNLVSDMVIKDDGFMDVRDYKLFDYYNITKILLMSMNKSIDRDILFSFISNLSDENVHKRGIDDLRKKRLNIDDDSMGYSDKQRTIFKMAFDSMVRVYGYEETKKNFIKFMETGNYSCITRNDGAREMIFSNDIDREVANSIVLSWRCEVLDSAILTTYNKYGYSHTYSALVDLAFRNDFNGFTNDNNSRMELMNRFSLVGDVLNSIRERLIRLGYDKDFLRDNICRIYLDKVINGEMSKKR